ncbi:MAG: hypothetical protein ABIR68_00215 [Ilumatobacteraceae bacterium]
MSIDTISARALRDRLLSGAELAVLDAREQGRFSGERYSGVSVASKASGEWIERVERTPHLATATATSGALKGR